MMRALLIATALSAAGGAVCAQPANGGPTAMESCFQSARGVDSICSNPANDAVQRLDCLQKARTTLLECLDHVPQEIATGSVPSEQTAGNVTSGTPSETPSGTAPPELPAATTVPDKPSAAVSSDKPAAAASPDMPTAAVSSDKPAAAASPDPPARAVDIAPKPRDPNWIISETTSPVDYAPVITAAIRLPFSVKHAPTTFAIRCRGGRTELLVRTEGTWRASRTREVQVDYQIDDHPPVKLTWTASPDGKTAIYKDDAVGLLQSLPDGARLKIDVLDEPGPSHEATFQLTGLEAVREKIAVACKLAPAANKVSSEKR
jgi:hypothetical protein